LTLDDFGTGYSSLSYLQDYPFQIIKIDKSFVDNVLENSKVRHIVETVIGLAKGLNMDTVAEGVENDEQLELLTELHCSQIQGWYFSKALPSLDFIEYTRRNRRHNES